MSGYDYGPLQSYEITWMSGHVERVQAHQISWPQNGHDFTGLFSGGLDTKRDVVRYVHFHAALEGKYQLALSAREDDIRTIRNVSTGEPLPGGETS